MIRLVSHSDLDKEKWDRCVLASSTPLVYAESWYLDIVAPGWDGLIEDDYRSVMPLPHRRKFGIRYIFQPPFVQQLGVFGKADADEFIRTIPTSYRIADLVLNDKNQVASFPTATRPNLLLPLASAYDELSNGFSENTRRNLKRATKAGLRIETTVDLDAVIELFRSTKGQTVKLSHKTYDVLRAIQREALLRHRWEGYAAYDTDNRLLAGAFFLQSKHGWIFLFSATHPAGRETGAMSFVVDQFLRQHAGEKTCLDFEGSMDPQLYRFYQSFGAEESVYLSLRLNRMPRLWRWINP